MSVCTSQLRSVKLPSEQPSEVHGLGSGDPVIQLSTSEKPQNPWVRDPVNKANDPAAGNQGNRLCHLNTSDLLHFLDVSPLDMNFNVSVGVIPALAQNLMTVRCSVLSSDVMFST